MVLLSKGKVKHFLLKHNIDLTIKSRVAIEIKGIAAKRWNVGDKAANVRAVIMHITAAVALLSTMNNEEKKSN